MTEALTASALFIHTLYGNWHWPCCTEPEAQRDYGIGPLLLHRWQAQSRESQLGGSSTPEDRAECKIQTQPLFFLPGSSFIPYRTEEHYGAGGGCHLPVSHHSLSRKSYYLPKAVCGRWLYFPKSAAHLARFGYLGKRTWHMAWCSCRDGRNACSQSAASSRKGHI